MSLEEKQVQTGHSFNEFQLNCGQKLLSHFIYVPFRPRKGEWGKFVEPHQEILMMKIRVMGVNKKHQFADSKFKSVS